MSENTQLVYQHEDFIAVNKPAGKNFHDSGEEKGYFNTVQEEQGQKLFPVHRLDKVTSGLLLFATNKVAAAKFEVLFRTKRIAKYYIAIAPGKPKKKQGWIKGDMLSSRRGQYKLVRSMENPAITYFDSTALEQGVRGYFLQPKTGKTHQLRVAMKSVGAPIAGDKLYGQIESMANYDRCYLHALAISFSEFGGKHLITALPHEGELFKQATSQAWQCRLLESIF